MGIVTNPSRVDVIKGDQGIVTGLNKYWITTPWDRCAPIPITPEWLERLGFTKHHRGNLVLGMGYFELEFAIKNGWLYLSRNEYEDMLSHIKYVHQLQNLYFAITGQELTIRPETAER